VPNGSPYRFDLLMRGEIEATTLTEPYISLAEKKGCRLVISAFHHGTDGALGGTPDQCEQALVPPLLH
jgi:hypothetical protein